MTYTKVEYAGADIGPLYLGDIGRRTSVAKPVPREGQEQVISKGETVYLVPTSDVLLSLQRGTLKAFSSAGGATAGKPLSITENVAAGAGVDPNIKKGLTVKF